MWIWFIITHFNLAYTLHQHSGLVVFFRHTIFQTHRDGRNQVMGSNVTVMTQIENTYRILLDGTPLDTNLHTVGGNASNQNLAFANVTVTEGTYYLATADLESAFSAWLTMVPTEIKYGHTSSISLGNAGKFVVIFVDIKKWMHLAITSS